MATGLILTEGSNFNMNGNNIYNLNAGMNPTDAANMGNINTVVNAICSTQNGLTAPCLKKRWIFYH